MEACFFVFHIQNLQNAPLDKVSETLFCDQSVFEVLYENGITVVFCTTTTNTVFLYNEIVENTFVLNVQ